jgi:hypothetical protein
MELKPKSKWSDNLNLIKFSQLILVPLFMERDMVNHPDDGGSKYLWNVSQYLPDYKMLCSVNLSREMLLQEKTAITSCKILLHLHHGSATFSLPWATLAILSFVEGRKKINNVINRKQNSISLTCRV